MEEKPTLPEGSLYSNLKSRELKELSEVVDNVNESLHEWRVPEVDSSKIDSKRLQEEMLMRYQSHPILGKAFIREQTISNVVQTLYDEKWGETRVLPPGFDSDYDSRIASLEDIVPSAHYLRTDRNGFERFIGGLLINAGGLLGLVGALTVSDPETVKLCGGAGIALGAGAVALGLAKIGYGLPDGSNNRFSRINEEATYLDGKIKELLGSECVE